MAYGAKYRLSFSDIYQNSGNNYIATIFKKDYSGSIFELNASGDPLTIETDRSSNSVYRPIIGSTATLNVRLLDSDFSANRVWEDITDRWEDYSGVWDAISFNIEEFLLCGFDDFYIEIEKDSELYWKGWYVTSSDTTLDEIVPIDFSLKFSDLKLMKSYEYGYDVAEPAPPVQLANVFFDASTGGLLTFGATSVISPLVIDETTGGLSRIKNTGVEPITVRLNMSFDVINTLGFGDEAYFNAIVSNDSDIYGIKSYKPFYIYLGSNGIYQFTFDIQLEQNDGVRVAYVLQNIIPPYTPIGGLNVLSTSFASLNTIVDYDTTAIRFTGTDNDTIKNILLDCVINSKLELDIMLNSSYELQGDVLLDEVFTIYNTYVLKNAFLEGINKYKTFYEVLAGICSQFGLIAYQREGKFYITDYNNLVNNNTREYNKYSYIDKSFISVVPEVDTVIELNSAGFSNIGQSQSVRYLLPSRYIDLSNSPSAAINTINPSFTLISSRYISGSTYYYTMDGWTLYGYPTFDITNINNLTSIYGYARNATAPLNIYYGATGFAAMHTTQNDAKYMQTSEGRSVKKGDYFSVSLSYSYDARLGNTYKPTTKFAIILKVNDPNNPGTELTYYLNASGSEFTTTLAYQSGSNINLKGLKIPNDGTLFIRMLIPYGAFTAMTGDPTTNPILWVNYANIQTYSGSSSNLPSKQTYRTYVEDNKYTNDTINLDSILYIYDATRYDTPIFNPATPGGLSSINNFVSSSQITNLLTSEYRNPLISNYGNAVTPVSPNIYKNSGFPNTIISGNYKSTMNPIGSKFSYTITGFVEKTFILMDYKNDFKNSEQDATLYSISFADATAANIQTKLITQ